MAKVKLELRLPVDGGVVSFDAEWEKGTSDVTVKRSGVPTFETSLVDFEKLTNRTVSFIQAVKNLQG